MFFLSRPTHHQGRLLIQVRPPAGGGGEGEECQDGEEEGHGGGPEHDLERDEIMKEIAGKFKDFLSKGMPELKTKGEKKKLKKKS